MIYEFCFSPQITQIFTDFFFVIQSEAKNLNTYTIAFQILPPFGRLDDKGRKG